MDLILGVTAGHDASACVIADGQVASYVLRERVSGIRHHFGIDRYTIELALKQAGVRPADLSAVAMTSTQLNPGLIDDFDYFRFAPVSWDVLETAFRLPKPDSSLVSVANSDQISVRGKPIFGEVRRGGSLTDYAARFFEECKSFWRIPPELHRDWYWFLHASPILGPSVWESPFRLADLPKSIGTFLDAGAANACLHFPLRAKLDGVELKGVFLFHHAAHAASSFYSSPYREAVVVTHDGGTHIDSGFVFHGTDGRLVPIGPHYLECGAFYDAAAERVGFSPMGGAGKLMGLASYGRGLLDDVLSPGTAVDWSERAKVRSSGPSERWYGEVMLDLLSAAAKDRGLDITRLGNVAALPAAAANEVAHAVQDLVEKTMSIATRGIKNGFENALGYCPDALCLSGGVSLNCPANSSVVAQSGFNEVYVEPHCDDGGTSIGAAKYFHHHLMNRARPTPVRPASSRAMLGPTHSVHDQLKALREQFRELSIELIPNWKQDAAERLANNEIVAVFEGRSEAGPRALGHRSILANPADPNNWHRVNSIKGREQWRPLAPVILENCLQEWFTSGPANSPFMMFTYTCKPDRLARIPAVVHVDGTCRVQTVTQADGSLFEILALFEKATDLPLIMNTSFNGPRSPIIETPVGALEFLKVSTLDALYMDGYLCLHARRPEQQY